MICLKSSSRKKKLVLKLFSLVLVILALPLTVYLAEQRQEIRKEAQSPPYATSCSGITCGNCACEGWPDDNNCTGCGGSYCKRDNCGCGYSNCCYRNATGCVACNDLCRCGCFSSPPAPAATATPTPRATPTPCPVQVNPTGLSGSCSCALAKEGDCNCTLDWGDAPGATKYALRVNDGNLWKGDCNVPQYAGDICNDNVTTSSYTFTGKGGHTYTWWVHALNTCNNWSSGANGPQFTAPYAPVRPSNLACTPTCDSGLRITWTDNSDNEDGFRVIKDYIYSPIGAVGPNVTLFDYSWCGDHDNHSYIVYSYKDIGGGASCALITGSTGVTCACPACPTVTPTPTSSPTPSPTPTSTPSPTGTITPRPTATATLVPTATPTPICCSTTCSLNPDCPGRTDCPGGVCDDCNILTHVCYQIPPTPTPTTGAVIRTCTWANISPDSWSNQPLSSVINQNQYLIVRSLLGGASRADIHHVTFSSADSSTISLTTGRDENGADGFTTTARAVKAGGPIRILTQIYLTPNDDVADCFGETFVSVTAGGGNAWFQSELGDVHAQGAINVQIPPPSPVMNPNFSVALAGNQPGIISYGGASASFGQGFPSSNAQNHWLVKTNVGLNTYSFFKQLLGSPTTPNWDGLSIFSLPVSGETKVLYTKDQTAFLPSITCSSTGRLIILTDADVVIERGNIIVDPGCFLAVVSLGEIRINGSVSHVQGVYIAGSTFSTGMGNLAFTGEGIFVAQNFVLTRDLGGSNQTTPAEKFIYRPDFLMNSEKFWLAAHTWEEKAPKDQ